jgi:hypothetical protein
MSEQLALAVEPAADAVKRCSKCAVVKAVGEFYAKRAWCKACLTGYERKRYAKPENRAKALDRAAAAAAKPGNRESHRRYSRKYYAKTENRESMRNRHLWHGMLKRSRAKCVAFDEAFFTPERVSAWLRAISACAGCGVAWAQFDGSWHGVQPNSPSIDRRVPALGYVPGNVNLICHRCNTLKGDSTPEELRRLADWMERPAPSQQDLLNLTETQ